MTNSFVYISWMYARRVYRQLEAKCSLIWRNEYVYKHRQFFIFYPQCHILLILCQRQRFVAPFAWIIYKIIFNAMSWCILKTANHLQDFVMEFCELSYRLCFFFKIRGNVSRNTPKYSVMCLYWRNCEIGNLQSY